MRRTMRTTTKLQNGMDKDIVSNIVLEYRASSIALREGSTLETPELVIGNVSDGNYTRAEEDGTLVAVGDAKCWRDEASPLIGQKLYSDAGRIDYDYDEGAVNFNSNANLNDWVIINKQLNHDYDEVTPLRPHIHWFQAEDATPNFLLEYRWQMNGSAKTQTWTRLIVDSTPVYEYQSGTFNQISRFPEVAPPEDVSTSDIIQYRIYRDSANASGLFSGADAYTADSLATSFDSHISIDMLGSRTEFTK